MRHKIKEAISGFLLILIKLRITYDNSLVNIRNFKKVVSFMIRFFSDIVQHDVSSAVLDIVKAMKLSYLVNFIAFKNEILN